MAEDNIQDKDEFASSSEVIRRNLAMNGLRVSTLHKF